ncbi:hypothetical protein JTE90_000845 [Oedothorax gibbosus]|uniref:Uncharacterized protein n=1 Tax=Oedothorax gibbosus TaxID=931172 RepID=A0AAV6VSA1_9ARAC|nr:hypothetical protein JTE90_000845 [Oedothorax gibbosus]
MALFLASLVFFATNFVAFNQARVASNIDYNLLAADHTNQRPMVEHWADLVYDFIGNLTCEDSFLSTEEDCVRLVSIPKSRMNLYSAEAGPGQKLKAVLPDGPLTRFDAHDVVLVVDPYPEANLGHLLLVFFVDLYWTQMQCQLNGGQFTEDGACLQLALRRRCHNALLFSSWKVDSHRKRQCEINFFPLVHLATETPSQKVQKLQCRDQFTGFGPCPTLRPQNHTDTLFCDALQENTLRCSTSATTVGARCRLFERCDHAVLISGGWDRITDRPMYQENMLGFRDMLMRNGFPHSNVKMFYSNGNDGIDEHLEARQEVFPAAFKNTMRYHIRKICQSVHCADSLILYLNSPTRNDGASLLWDIDRDGQIEDNEVYTIRELLYDTQDCMAQQVYLVADQNFAGKIVHALEHSTRHRNVMAFASSGEHEYSWNGDYTRLWSEFDHQQYCVGETYEILKADMNSSQPLFFDGSEGALNTTLYGAPCDVMPPFTEYELNKRFYGCQNLPSSIWFRRTGMLRPDWGDLELY